MRKRVFDAIVQAINEVMTPERFQRMRNDVESTAKTWLRERKKWVLEKVFHRTWEQFQARLAFTMATFNLLIAWNGFEADSNGMFHLSIAQFSL